MSMKRESLRGQSHTNKITQTIPVPEGQKEEAYDGNHTHNNTHIYTKNTLAHIHTYKNANTRYLYHRDSGR